MSKIILDLCGGTGAWSKPYKDAGYDVRVITLPDYDVTDWHTYYDYGLVFPRSTSQDNLACVRLTPGYLDEHLCYINSVRQQLAYPYASAWKNLARRIG